MTKKGHDSRAIANIFVEKSRNTSNAAHPLTIMSLLKYVYFAHGWTLGHTNSPLICHKVEAWKYGPVVPEVYNAFNPQGTYIKEKRTWYPEPKLLQEEREIIDSVYEEYSKLPALRLSAITHAKGTPWHKYRDTYYGEIPNEEIKNYYKDLVEKMKNNEHS